MLKNSFKAPIVSSAKPGEVSEEQYYKTFNETQSIPGGGVTVHH
jgi:hypothetical protein